LLIVQKQIVIFLANLFSDSLATGTLLLLYFELMFTNKLLELIYSQGSSSLIQKTYISFILLVSLVFRNTTGSCYVYPGL